MTLYMWEVDAVNALSAYATVEVKCWEAIQYDSCTGNMEALKGLKWIVVIVHLLLHNTHNYSNER